VSRVRQARRRAGLSQEELAKASGISPATVVQVELGHRRPQGRTLRKLSAALGVEVADLVEEEVNPTPKVPLEVQEEPEPDAERRTNTMRLRAMEIRYFSNRWREEIKNPAGQNVWWCGGVQALACGLHDMARGLGYTQKRDGESPEERAARYELLDAIEEMHSVADEVLEVAEESDEAYSATEEAQRRRKTFGVIQGFRTA
jgi:transcriptional regulator with XRE-family HTH domain